MSQICHRISKEPGKDISQSGHELHAKNREKKSWKSHDRPFLNELTPNPKLWFTRLIQFHSLAVLLQMHVHPLPRIEAPLKSLDIPKQRYLETLVWGLKVAQMSLCLTFVVLYCAVRPCRPRKGSAIDTVSDERLHPKIWEAFCMAFAFTLATWGAKFVVKHRCGKCTACK